MSGAPGMAVQALAAEIVKALLADENDGGFDLTAGLFGPAFSAMVRRWAALEYAACLPPVPIDMILHCPKCGRQHIDAADDSRGPIKCQKNPKCSEPCGEWCGWTNPPHRSHLCAGCGHVWRPADVPTNGVQAIKTKGTEDCPPVVRGPVAWKPTELQILEAAERAGLWPNTVRHWLPAFDRFFDALQLAAPQSAEVEPQFTELEIGHACADVGISDSQFESLTIALQRQQKG